MIKDSIKELYSKDAERVLERGRAIATWLRRGSEECQNAVLCEGFLPTLLSVLRQRADDRAFLARACPILQAASSEVRSAQLLCRTECVSQLRQLLLGLCGSSAVATPRKPSEKRQTAQIITSCCATIRNLCVDEECCRHVSSRELLLSLHTVASARSAFGDEVLAAVCWLLAAIPLPPGDTCASRTAADGIDPTICLLCSALHAGLDGPTTVAACTALESLSRTERCRTVVAREGGIGTLWCTARASTKEPAVVLAALRALSQLASADALIGLARWEEWLGLLVELAGLYAPPPEPSSPVRPKSPASRISPPPLGASDSSDYGGDGDGGSAHSVGLGRGELRCEAGGEERQKVLRCVFGLARRLCAVIPSLRKPAAASSLPLVSGREVAYQVARRALHLPTLTLVAGLLTSMCDEGVAPPVETAESIILPLVSATVDHADLGRNPEQSRCLLLGLVEMMALLSHSEPHDEVCQRAGGMEALLARTAAVSDGGDFERQVMQQVIRSAPRKRRPASQYSVASVPAQRPPSPRGAGSPGRLSPATAWGEHAAVGSARLVYDLMPSVVGEGRDDGAAAVEGTEHAAPRAGLGGRASPGPAGRRSPGLAGRRSPGLGAGAAAAPPPAAALAAGARQHLFPSPDFSLWAPNEPEPLARSEDPLALRNHVAGIRQRGTLSVHRQAHNGTAEPPAEGGLRFSSDFESGNLLRAVQVEGTHEYNLVLSADTATRGHTQWFYFAVQNAQPNIPYVFNIINMEKGDSLYNAGGRPLLYSKARASASGIGWHRCGEDVAYFPNGYPRERDEGKVRGTCYTLTFTVRFPHGPEDVCYIAHCYPYTYSQLQRRLFELEASPAHASVLERELLCTSREGNRCDMLVVTNFRRFDGARTLSAILRAAAKRHSERNKMRTIVLTARVHPGESNASWVMDGLLRALTADSYVARWLRDEFVFVLVPMLNPDGVIHGNYRCNLAGVDMNRHWARPDKEKTPPIFHLRALMESIRRSDVCEISMLCDIHGHSRKQNVFLYGCGTDTKQGTALPGKRLHERVFGQVLGQVCEVFDKESCSYAVRDQKRSTARVVARCDFGVLNAFTLESSMTGTDRGDGGRPRHLTIRDFERIGGSLVAGLHRYALMSELEHCEIVANLRMQEAAARGVDASGHGSDSDEETAEAPAAAEPPPRSPQPLRPRTRMRSNSHSEIPAKAAMLVAAEVARLSSASASRASKATPTSPTLRRAQSRDALEPSRPAAMRRSLAPALSPSTPYLRAFAAISDGLRPSERPSRVQYRPGSAPAIVPVIAGFQRATMASGPVGGGGVGMVRRGSAASLRASSPRFGSARGRPSHHHSPKAAAPAAAPAAERARHGHNKFSARLVGRCAPGGGGGGGSLAGGAINGLAGGGGHSKLSARHAPRAARRDDGAMRVPATAAATHG